MEETLINIINNYGALAILASFVVGAITSIAPCSILTLPLLIGSVFKLSEGMEKKEKVRFTYLFSSLFVLGLILSFSILAFIVAKFGGFLSVAPAWVYILASVVAFLLALYGLGIFPSVDKTIIVNKLIKFKLFGALLIGGVFGLVSTPCASAPLATIIAVASESSYIYSYMMIIAFAIGHGLLLFIAGISVGFAENIIKNNKLAMISSIINKLFTVVLFLIAIYFFMQAYKQF